MKPLNLTIFECHECGDTRCFVIEHDKRLMDAELAAEFHAQQMEAVKAFDRAYPYGESAELDAENVRIEVMERFATLPHYDAPPETGTQA